MRAIAWLVIIGAIAAIAYVKLHTDASAVAPASGASDVSSAPVPVTDAAPRIDSAPVRMTTAPSDAAPPDAPPDAAIPVDAAPRPDATQRRNTRPRVEPGGSDLDVGSGRI